MNVATRGARNAFRNATRTISIVIILSLSIGLSLVMLIANQAVNQKITKTLEGIGNTINIRPAGSATASSVSSALSEKELAKLQSLPHISGISELLVGHLKTEGTTDQPTPPPGAMVSGIGTGQDDDKAKTNILNPYKLDCTGGTCAGPGMSLHANGQAPSLPSNFSLPIDIVGTSTPTQADGIGAQAMKITDGKAIDGSVDNGGAMISQKMADHNKLKVGDTFRAYGKTLTVAAIFKADTTLGNSSIVVSLPTMQRLTDQPGIVSRAVATTDSLTNLKSATADIKQTLGDRADVTSRVDEAENALKPLRSVQSISAYSLIGSVVAGTSIILLVMVMIVRERKREIGVYKAIGHSNLRIMMQFASEALTFTLIAAVIGLVIGVAAGGPITDALVSGATDPGTDGNSLMAPPGLQDLQTVKAVVGLGIIGYGLATATLVALAGSMIASFFIAKIRPAEVLRNE